LPKIGDKRQTWTDKVALDGQKWEKWRVSASKNYVHVLKIIRTCAYSFHLNIDLVFSIHLKFNN